MEPKKWKINGKEMIADTGFIKLYAIDAEMDGKKKIFSSVDMDDWVIIFALTCDPHSGEWGVITVKQHRLGTDEITVELPAGAIEKGEDPLEAAKRELAEETGFTTESWTNLYHMNVNPACESNHVYFYLAFDCQKTQEQDLDPDENIVVEQQDFVDIMTHAHKFSNSLSLLCAYIATNVLSSLLGEAEKSKGVI